MAQVTDEQIDNWFQQRQLDNEAAADLEEVNALANKLAKKIRDVTPYSVQQIHAIQIQLRDVVLWTEEAIKSGGV